MTSEFPLEMGSSESFRIVREFLTASGYTEEFLLSHFRLFSIHFLLYPYGLQAEYLSKRYEAEDGGMALELARLFLAGQARERQYLEALFTPPVLEALEELKLLVPATDGMKLRVPVTLYPALGFFIASDRGFSPEGPGYRGKDYVMSGTESICRHFIASLPERPCKRYLDMGTGAGLAALLGSRVAEESYGVDITERAVRYARFNGKLNGVSNLDIRQGDLFAPVEGLLFDRIVSNPPFEPPLKEGMIFSVGGADGEAIIKRIVEESPGYLEPGGRLYCQICGTDREGESFEERIRGWLGEAAKEFDSTLYVRLTFKPNEYAIQQILGENQDAWKLQEWNMFYHKLKATQVIVGHLILQKRQSERPVFATRRVNGADTGLPEMEWLMELETRFVQPDAETFLFDSRPVPGKGWELHVRHGLRDGKLQPLSYTFFTTYPFEVNLHVPAWMAMLVSRCDGKQTAREHFEYFQSRANLPKEEFLKAYCALVASDFLRIEGMAPPRTPAGVEA